MADGSGRGGRGRSRPEHGERERRPGLPMAGQEHSQRGRARGREPRPAVPEQVRPPHLPPERQPSHGGPSPVSSPRYPPSGYGTPRQQLPRSGASRPSSQSSYGRPSTSSEGGRQRGESSSSQRDLSNPIWPSEGFSKRGTLGDPTRLLCNYFAFSHNPQMIIHQYHVDFTPSIENTFMSRAMIYKHKDVLGERFLFDGAALWLFKELQSEITELFSTRITDGAQIRIRIKKVGIISSRDPVTLQILGSQMRKYFSILGFKLFGRVYFDIHDCVTLERYGIELFPGYTTAIHQFESNVLMNCNTTFKFTRQNTVLHILRECQQNFRNFKEECEKKLLGQIVMTMYNNRTYRIAEISWNVHPTDTFDRKGQAISYIDYMLQTWNKKVEDPRQPMLLSRPKARDIRRGDSRPILLIPEMCVVTGVDEETRKNFAVMKEIANHTRKTPAERVQKLKAFLNRLKTNEQISKEMSEWGIDFATNLQEIQARTLKPEGIICTSDRNDRGAQYDAVRADWSQILKLKPLLEPTRLAMWVLVHTSRHQPEANDFMAMVRDVSRPMGITVSNPNVIVCPDDRTQTFIQGLNRHMGEQLQMIVAVIPPDRKDLYDAIKKMCCITFGIPSQVVTSKALSNSRALKSITTNIAIQMNCKLGGQAWRVSTPFTNTMVVGIDTYHDTSQRNMSACAVVCSTNDFHTKYHSRVVLQEKGQEMSNELIELITSGLKRNYELNKKLPERIIIYRDGVGEGQINQVKDWEVTQILEAFAKQGPNYDPEVIFVIVNKRITTRLFKPTGGSRGGQGGYGGRGGGGNGSQPGPSSYGARPSSYGARPTPYGSYGARPVDRGRGHAPSPRGGYGSQRGYGPRPGFGGPRPPMGPGGDHGQGGREYENPLPGTVVDSEITRPGRFDFFLVSQHVNQGTVTPTYYNVIHQHINSNISVSILQRFTYQLCHLYYNWQGTIRVPAPTQYAHKLAFLVGESLHSAPSSETLADTLYYL